MLEYEWGNPSQIMLSGDEPTTQDSDQSRQIFEHYHQSLTDHHHHHHHNLFPQPTTAFSHHHFHHQQHEQQHDHTHLQSLYDPRAYTTSYPHPPPSMLTLEPLAGTSSGGGGGGVGGGFLVVPKSEEVGRPGDFTARIGLNLGHRTYFSTDDDFVNRLYRRSRQGPAEPGSGNSPRCQAEGCNADLTHAKHYHRRHKVCEYHSKASTVITNGLTQRFCQQCSRFHILSEFDNGKRSCRKRLADHNRRRRKSQQPNQDHHKSQLENARNSSSENLASKLYLEFFIFWNNSSINVSKNLNVSIIRKTGNLTSGYWFSWDLILQGRRRTPVHCRLPR
ncbi:hypothetical protein L1049_019076 [Liquidambar formosana]|uniref:SBP-type domain-containing protein n=1 Tax=Liquidambar formosana TaxID=63359 RepID=A0AAP0RBX7_LIQFO